MIGLAKSIFVNQNHIVVVANNAASAITILGHGVDIAVLDLELGHGGSVIGVLEKCRKTKTKVYILSGFISMFTDLLYEYKDIIVSTNHKPEGVLQVRDAISVL